MDNNRALQRLRCSVQNSDWGKRGDSSHVARLYAFNSGSRIQPDSPYAELWMGTHESGPSHVAGSSNRVRSCESLKDWIQKNPSVLGDHVLHKWGCDLPFLFKVLSIARPLSIQAHPDKALARRLHKLQPELYKDDNHKPEMALAITDFEALCGFIGFEELKLVIHDTPELVDLIGYEDALRVFHVSEEDDKKSILRTIFTRIMSADKETIVGALAKMKMRLQKETHRLNDKEQLVLKLEKQYPGDVGVISSFFFNYIKLKPGEALYLGANEPHAYLSGDCVECMATSDNVVRAGLSSKHLDVKTLCSMLSYKQGFPEILKGYNLTAFVRRYCPPFDEFEVDRCILPMGELAVFPPIPGPSIFLITSGEGEMQGGSVVMVVGEGDVLFAASDCEIVVSASSELHLYRAGLNSRVFKTL